MDKKDIKLTPLSTAICRTPAFSLTDNLTNSWPALKKLIKEASPAFFEVIKDATVTQLDEKAAHTVWKYFNRARFRATPFGSFAAISFLSVRPDAPSIVLNSNMFKRRFISWSEKDDVAATTMPQWIIANATCYIFGREVRYLRYMEGQFELTSVNNFTELQAVLSAARQAVTIAEICGLLAAQFKLATSSANELLSQLISAQILFTEHAPNITGKDYFERMRCKIRAETTGYIMAEKTIKEGAIDKNQLHDVSAYLRFMHGFLPLPQHTALNAFKTAFQKKFDRKAIPLAFAIDPQIGIGYGNTAQNPEDEMQGLLLESLQQRGQNEHHIVYNAQHRFLLNSLLQGGPIQLENYTEPAPDNLPALPNTLSVMYHNYRGQMVVGHAGGCTANALLGRFTLGNNEATEKGKAIAAIEEKANPEVLFFDVAYQAEKQVDNVNRRASLYQAELPLLTWSCHSLPLYVDDILVAVRGDEIVLWSKKHQKRIVPRIASAYNYTRSDLALFRFLCDLQHQGLRSDLSFSLKHIFPDLKHYPRVYYKNIIVSSASWLVDKAQTKNVEALKDWLQARQINSPFSCGKADQTLLINPKKQEDLEAFIRYAAQNKELYITEALSDCEGVKNENGKAYAAQYIADFSHNEQIYPGCQPFEEVQAGHSFLPGDEWLYVEIYGHATQANNLLTKIIKPFLAGNKAHFEQWFFIRYTDGGPHIRLRLKLADAGEGSLLLNKLNTQLKPLYNQGHIWDLQVKTYLRETERYGAERIALAEEFFAVDSAYVLRLLKSAYQTVQLYNKSLQLMERLTTLAFPEATARLGFIQAAADSFAREFRFDGDDYKKINRSFEELESKAEPLKLSKHYLKTFIRVMDSCTNDGRKMVLLGDLLHMHVNRVFYNNQRLHEAILYQYLLKRAKMARYVKPANA